ncbi:methyl-accepting chemotaxis protein [Megalodesulfovibrio gigas]|uniref:Putative methyl-accepting chemotaxis sensory transducer n=1 Tax=Megalodesulfovibrio gigas (strain ATCC 19364 / DSM 1382 / NCIMB 9332 / VKM B-1759) TaxID=1121448 RepID=T2GDY5_MEGG1|nr:HAMP domain-containing methyl-accepting chemotaxis protein [Megalodesulfovibrio gigas]AGW14336.1 putative methyl-accepting chemotaxis sensory transducer [Megalodesulfovibrio gigas DSM 1382 = ATCC 19364]
MKNIRIGMRLIGAFVIVAVLTVAVGVEGYIGLRTAEKEIEEMADVYLPSIDALARMRYNMRNLTVVVRTLLIADLSDQERARQRDLLRQARENYGQAMKKFESLERYENEERVWQAFLVQLQKTRDINDKTLDMIAAWEKNLQDRALYDAATAQVIGETGEANRVLIGQISQLIELNLENAEKDKLGAKTNIAGHITLMASMGIFSPLLAFGLGLMLTRSIIRPLGQTLRFAENVAQGDLDAELAVRQGDEVGRVAESLRAMVETLKKTLRQAQEQSRIATDESENARRAMAQAEEAQRQAVQARAQGLLEAAHKLEDVVAVVSSASEQLSAQVEQSSRGAEIQTDRVTETATAMEEMNATVLEVAKNASQASDSADSARKQAADGAAVVGEVVKGIGQVEAQAQSLKTDMGDLGRQAEGIGQILNVISDIADQTNLLALNAAIEAARAGDAGRGFAVVADEVRKLAEKTMQATKEVGQAISGIQQGARKNLDNAGASAQAIERVTAMARQAGEALRQIVTLADTVSDQVRNIAAASEQQSATSEEINRSIEDINRVSAETLAAMRQSTQAVGELAVQSQKLQQLINNLKSEGEAA